MAERTPERQHPLSSTPGQLLTLDHLPPEVREAMRGGALPQAPGQGPPPAAGGLSAEQLVTMLGDPASPLGKTLAEIRDQVGDTDRALEDLAEAVMERLNTKVDAMALDQAVARLIKDPNSATSLALRSSPL